MNQGNEHQTADLVFGLQNQVIVLNGKKDFVRLSTDILPKIMYVHGSFVEKKPPTLLDLENVECLFGRFLVLVHDTYRQTLTIYNDRYGFIPFYTAFSSGSLYFSLTMSSFFKNNILDKRINVSALSDIYAFDIPLGAKSLFEGVTGIEAGCRLHIALDTRKTDKTKSWDPIQILNKTPVPLDQVESDLFDAFMEGYKKCFQHAENVGLTLSGGIDSRCLLAGAVHLKKHVATYNTGVKGSRSEIYAAQMAATCEARHHSYPLDQKFIERYYDALKHTITLTEGMSFSSEAEGYWLSRHVLPDQIVLHGAFAELYKLNVMHNFNLDRRLMFVDQNTIKKILWRRFESRFELRLKSFSSDFKEALLSHAQQNLEEKIETYDSDLNAGTVLQLLYIEEYLSKVTKYSCHIWNQHVQTYFPFSYPKYVDLLLNVRVSDRLNQIFPIYFLKRTSKKLYNFPDSNTGAKIGSSKALVEMIHVMDWIKKKIFDSKLRYEHTNVANWLKGMTPMPGDILSACEDQSIFNKQQVDSIISHSNQGDNEAADSLRMLVLFLIWRDAMQV